MDYKTQGTECAKSFVMSEMRRQFEECGCDLDAQYKKYGDTPYFFAQIVEPGHIYILGYPRCVCPKVAQEKITDPAYCECSRQSIIYVLENLVPDKRITVENIGTVLSGAARCSFRVTVE